MNKFKILDFISIIIFLTLIIVSFLVVSQTKNSVNKICNQNVSCYLTTSLNTNKIDFCLNNNLNKKQKLDCVYNYIILKNESSELCYKLINKKNVFDCLFDCAYSRNNFKFCFNQTTLKKFQNFTDSYRCLTPFAIKLKNYKLCNFLNNKTKKYNCIYNFAIYYNNISLCNKTIIYKNYCLKRLNNK